MGEERKVQQERAAPQGGIRKDPSTFSYQVLGAALSIFMLLALRGLHTQVQAKLAGIGRNPLLAYVAGGGQEVPGAAHRLRRRWFSL